jgi:hypothetical protein
VLDKLEAVEREGLPSRNANPDLEHELRDDLDEVFPVTANSSDADGAEPAVEAAGDLERAMKRLKGREQDILRLYHSKT